MALPGELITPDQCEDCTGKLVLQVCQSAAGFYIGTQCQCGPYSRDSGYFPTREEAEANLDSYKPRDTAYHGLPATPIISIGSRRIGTKGHYIGRTTPLGNRYAPPNGIETPDSLASFKRWLWAEMKNPDSEVSGELDKLLAESLSGGVTLVCWCKKATNDSTPCHGDTIKAAINYLAAQIATEAEKQDVPTLSIPDCTDECKALTDTGMEDQARHYHEDVCMTTATLADIQNETDLAERTKCVGTTVKGKPCARWSLDGFNVCGFHLPR